MRRLILNLAALPAIATGLKKAEAVVIGSGALGSSIAFHLVKAGFGPVALVDRYEMASQTSPRAAGLTSQIRKSDLMTRLATMAVDRIRDFTAATGEELVYFQSGSLRIARTPEHERQLQEDVERGRRLGVNVEFVSPAKAQQLMPFLEQQGIRAVTYSRDDLYFEPGQLPRGYVKATARLGGVLLPNTAVVGIGVENGGVTKVITDQGEIRTPIVVDAAGAWIRLVAGLAGVRAGAIATRHQLLITHPIAGVEAHQPITRVMDCNIYIRPSEGGLLVGGYEPDPLQIEMGDVPPSFRIDDLPLDLSVLYRLIDRVADQFPVLRGITIREHRGGLPTMTPDGEHIVGSLPELRGFYVAGGCCVGGLSIAPIIGELLAEWIVTGNPPMDLSALSPARSAVQSTAEHALRADCRRQYAFHYWAEPADRRGVDRRS
jgi:glycine/D-amino acid oxidase-like deaminating enzyme